MHGPLEDTAPARAEAWLTEFDRLAGAGDPAALADLFLPESYWRDALALGWTLRTEAGALPVAHALAPALASAEAKGFRLDPDAPPPQRVSRAMQPCIEATFLFETAIASCRGMLRLDPDGPRAWTLLTAINELKGHEAAAGRNRPTGQTNSRDFRGPNWLDQRTAARTYADRDPTVIVVGAGQAGLAVAARLTALGIDTLVVERNARVGDNWRHRYHALTLHNQVHVNHLPYLPFPETWPVYIPKDKLANWLEHYAEAMELNVWTGTELTSARRDGDGHWSARLRLADGSERQTTTHHVILATGVSGIPNRPDIPGLEDFAGPVLHSSEYRDGEDWSGKRAVVFGTGNSGHDIAQDLHSSGAAVTLVQRSPSLVVNIEPSAQLPYAFYADGPSTAHCDLIALSMPVPLTRRAHVGFTKAAREADAPLLDKLEERGFRLDFGEDGTGWQFKYLTRGGGYYFNVGCSDLIAEGAIDLLANDRIERVGADGLRLTDGTSRPADLVVLATGYKGQEHLVAKLFGEDVAANVGPVWGFGAGLELRNMFVPTPERGLWFIAGSLAQCRIYSKYLALGIAAEEAGLRAPQAAT